MGWTAKGYQIGGNVGELINSLASPAIIVGSAYTVFEEYAAALKRFPDAQVFAVNDMIPLLPVVHHAMSLHADKLVHWIGLRACDFPTRTWKSHSRNSEDGKIDYCWRIDFQMGLSGYWAMQVAYLMGCNPIILCGCPGDSTRRIIDPKTRIDFDYFHNMGGGDGVGTQLLGEMKRLPEFKATVRSLGGWTQSFFGGIDNGAEKES